MKKYILLIVALLVVGCAGQEDVEKYKTEISRLTTENEALKGQVEELQTISGAVMEESIKRVNELQNELDELKSQNSQSVDAKVKKLEKENADLKNKGVQKDNLIKDLKNQVSNLETSNKLLNGENKKLKDQSVRLKAAEEDLNKIIEENRKFVNENSNLSVEKKQELNRMEKQAKDAFDELDAEIENY